MSSAFEDLMAKMASGRTIERYQLPAVFNKWQAINVTGKIQIIHAQFIGDKLFFWAEADPRQCAAKQLMQIIATGDVVPDGAHHGATVWYDGFPYHIYFKEQEPLENPNG